MRFEGFKLARFVMYNGWLVGFGMIVAWMVLYPLALGKGFIFFDAMQTAFFKDIKLTALFVGIIAWAQIEGFLISRTKPKFLEVLEDKAVFHLLSGKVYEFKYCELSSLGRTNNLYKIFEFTFKNGKKQSISDSVKNSELAFKIIREKIAEAKSKSV